MDFEQVSDAALLIFDTLKDDKDSEEIITFIDEADGDDDMKKGFRLAVERLDVVNPAVSKAVREKAKGFAF